MATNLDIDISAKLKSSYSLKGKTEINILGESFSVKDISASGSTLVINLENGKTIKLTKISNPDKINFVVGETTQTLQQFYETNLPETKTWLSTPSATKLTGTVFDDDIDIYNEYEPTVKNSLNDIGVKINADTGNDTIKGTALDDTITGGSGVNTIKINTTKKFGNDVYKLTKGETLKIETTGEETVTHDKDTKGNIIVTVKNADEETMGTLTIAGLAKKDITQGVTINGEAITFDFDEDNISKNKITGTAQNDEIDVKDAYLEITKGKGKNKTTRERYATESGVTINSGTGNDTITGTKYSDTITAGTGENTIKILKDTFGNDTINLTKGEKLTLDLSAYTDITSANDLKGKVSGNNLVITIPQDTTTNYGTITLKNFAKSNVVNDGYVRAYLGKDTNNDDVYVDLNSDEVLSYKSKDFSKNDNKKTATFTGSRFGETITDDTSLNDYTKTINTGNGTNTVNINSTGKTTINGGSGIDNIRIDGDGTHIVKTGAGKNTVVITGKGTANITGGADKDTIRVYNNDADTTINAGNGDNIVYIQGSTAKNTITTGSGADTITLATNADDITSTVNAGNGTNTIDFKGKGNNTIISGKDNDTINVNTGTTNTTIKAGTGKNTINISNGSNFGNIIIEEEKVSAKNIINFATAINTDYTLTKSGNDLIIQNDKNNSKITINGYYLTRTNKTKYAEIVFKIANSEKNYSVEDLVSSTGKKLNVIGSGTIAGTENDDNILADDYDTTVKESNDTITAGKGDDTINAGRGTNKIRFNVGDGDDTVISGGGTDTLVFDNNVPISASYNGNDLVISYGDKDDTVTLENYANGHSVKNIQIGNNRAKSIDTYLPQPKTLKVGDYNIIQGTDNADIINASLISTNQFNIPRYKIFGGGGNDTLTGGNGDDYIYGGAGDDTIAGGKGNDYLYGGSGKNIFYFNADDGQDFFYEDGVDNTLVFNNISSINDLKFDVSEYSMGNYSNYDLIIKYSKNGTVTIKNFLSQPDSSSGYVYDFSGYKIQAGANGTPISLLEIVNSIDSIKKTITLHHQ